MASTAELLLLLANSPGGQALLRTLLERPDTPQADVEAKLKSLKTADWPDEPKAPEAPRKD